jgi:hypothetical protein
MSSLPATCTKAGEYGWLIRASDARFTARQEWQAHAAGWETGLPGVWREHGSRKSAASGSLPDAA